MSASRCARAWGMVVLVTSAVACSSGESTEPTTEAATTPITTDDPVSGSADGASTETAGDQSETENAPAVSRTVREVDGVPAEMPSGAVPEGATNVEGIVTTSDDAFSAAVEFDIDASDSDAVLAAVEPAIRAAGFEFVERLYDADRIQSLYSSPSGSLLTYTLTRTDSGLRGAIVVGS